MGYVDYTYTKEGSFTYRTRMLVCECEKEGSEQYDHYGIYIGIYCDRCFARSGYRTDAYEDTGK